MNYQRLIVGIKNMPIWKNRRHAKRKTGVRRERKNQGI